jgi:hypothetical protein
MRLSLSGSWTGLPNFDTIELSIATSPDPHSVEPSTPPATHDVLLVADYIQTGLISSPVDIFLRPYSPSEDHAHASVIAIPASPLEIPRNVDLSRAISRTLAPLQAGGKLKDYEEGADLEVPSTDPNGSTASTIYNKSRHGLKADGRRRSSVGGSGKGMVSPVLGRRTLAAKRKQTRLSQSFGGEGEKSSMMSISMSVSMDESSRMDSSLGGLVQEQSGEKEEGCSLTDIGGELMRVLRRITERALTGEMDPQRALAQGRKRRRVDGVKGRIRDRIVRTDAIGVSRRTNHLPALCMRQALPVWPIMSFSSRCLLSVICLGRLCRRNSSWTASLHRQLRHLHRVCINAQRLALFAAARPFSSTDGG